MKKTYYVTITYLATVDADSDSDAAVIAQQQIAEGDLFPSDIETEIAKELE